MKDRLKKKLKAKKLLQKGKPDFSLFKDKPVVKKEYEMPDEYQKNLAILTEMIDKRDEYARAIPLLPPDKRAEAQPALAELSAAVENIEQTLADEYEKFQAEKHREDEIEQTIGRGMEAVENLFIIMKHQIPHLFEKFKQTVMQDMTEEEKQEFYDRIAILEATRLKEILAGK